MSNKIINLVEEDINRTIDEAIHCIHDIFNEDKIYIFEYLIQHKFDDLIINKLNKLNNVKIKELFLATCHNDYLEVAQFLLKNTNIKLNEEFISICINGHLEEAQYLHDKFSGFELQINETFKFICKIGNLNLA